MTYFGVIQGMSFGTLRTKLKYTSVCQAGQTKYLEFFIEINFAIYILVIFVYDFN